MKQKCKHNGSRYLEMLNTWLKGNRVYYEMQVYCEECGEPLHTYQTIGAKKGT